MPTAGIYADHTVGKLCRYYDLATTADSRLICGPTDGGWRAGRRKSERGTGGGETAAGRSQRARDERIQPKTYRYDVISPFRINIAPRVVYVASDLSFHDQNTTFSRSS